MTTSILNTVRKELTGRTVELPPRPMSCLVETSLDFVNPPEFRSTREVRIGVFIGIYASYEEGMFDSVMKNVIESIRHDLYGSFIKQLLDLERAVVCRNNDEILSRLRDLLKEVSRQ